MAGILNLNFDDQNFVAATQGADFTASLTWVDSSGNPVDLSTFTARMQIRRTYGDTIVVELNTTNGYIALTNQGAINFHLPYTVTETLPAGIFLYDLFLTDSSDIPSCIMRGQFVINEAVTM